MTRFVKIGNVKWPATGLLAAMLLFAACKKDNSTYVRPPAAGLMAFNLAVDKPAIGFSLSGGNLGNSAIGYAGFTGMYAPIYTGNREVRSFDYNSGSTLAISNQDFKDSTYYSAFLLGANGSYRNLVVRDNFDSVKPVSGKAWVRYINAIADSTITPVVAIGEQSESATYATVSPFRQVNTGAQTVSVNSGSTVNASRALTFDENKIYTVLLLGQPNQSDSTKAVQVRFIQNGTASE